jgi:hypothetical protein
MSIGEIGGVLFLFCAIPAAVIFLVMLWNALSRRGY